MTSIAHSSQQSATVADILKALAHPIRLRIVALLCESERHVGGLAERLGLAQSAVSQQIGILRTRGLVARNWQNGRAVYRLAEPALPELLRCLHGCTETRRYAR